MLRQALELAQRPIRKRMRNGVRARHLRALANPRRPSARPQNDRARAQRLAIVEIFMPKKIRFSWRKTRRAARSSCLLIRIRTFPVTNRMKQHTFGAPESIHCLFSFFENRVRSALEIGGTRRTVAMRGSRGPGRRWLAPSILRCGWAAAASGSCSTSSRGRGAARSRQRLGSSRRRRADALL